MAFDKPIQKINEYTKKNSGFFDLAEPYGLFRKLKVQGKSQLSEIQFYRGGRLPSHEYRPKSLATIGQIQPNVELEMLLSERSCRHICFVGPAGIGKTTLTKLIARGALEGIYCGLSNVVAVLFLHCRDYNPGDMVSVGEFLFGKTDLTGKEIEYVFRLATKYPEKVLFILDSLDTLQYNVDGVYKFINVHEKACPEAILWNFLCGNLFPGCQIVTSSREYTIRNYMGEVRPGKVVTILGLAKESIIEVVIGYVGETEAKEFMLYLKTKAPSLQALCNTPVILVYSLIGYKASFDFIPTTSTGCLIVVLQSIIRSQHTRHEDILVVMHKLEELSYNGMKEGRVLFTYDDLREVGLDPQDATDLTIFAPGGFAEKLFQGESRLFFSHQTLQEVFCALWISKMVPNHFKEVVKSFLNSSLYVVVRKFLYGVLFDREVKRILSRDLQSGSNLQANIKILREDIRSQLSSDLRDSDLLELLISLSEAKDGISDIIKSSLHRVHLFDHPLSSSDVFAIGSVISQCDHLEELGMTWCNLDASSLNLLGSQLKESKVKLRIFNLKGNENMGIDAFSAIGRIVTRNDVEELNLTYCRPSADQLQTLADSTKDATKLRLFNLSANESMGIDGISVVGTIVTRNDVEKLNLSCCVLSAGQLQTLADSTKNATKLQVVDLNFDVEDYVSLNVEHELGPEQTRSVGNLLSNVVREVNLSSYIISDEDVAYFQNKLSKLDKTGLRVQIGERYKKIFLSAKPRVEGASNVLFPAPSLGTQTKGHDVKPDDEVSDFGAVAVDAVRRSSSWTKVFNRPWRAFGSLTNRLYHRVRRRSPFSSHQGKALKGGISDSSDGARSERSDDLGPRFEDTQRREKAEIVEDSQEKFCETAGLEVSGNARDVTELAEDTLDCPADIKAEDIVKLPCSASKEKRISCTSGGAIELYDCKITVPPRCLEVDSTIKVTVESGNIDGRPNEYMTISSTMDCDLSKVQLVEGSELEVEMPTYCSADQPIDVDLLSRTMGSPEWVRERRLTLQSNEWKIVFKTAHFSRKRFAILRRIGLGRFVKFRITPHLYYNAVGVFHSYFCIDDKLVDQTIKNEHRDNGFSNALIVPQRLIARLGDEIEVRLQCYSPATYCIPEECWKFQLSKKLIDLVSVSNDFQLHAISENVRQSIVTLHFLREKTGTPMVRSIVSWNYPTSLPVLSAATDGAKASVSQGSSTDLKTHEGTSSSSSKHSKTEDDDAVESTSQERNRPAAEAFLLSDGRNVTFKDCSFNVMAGNSGTQSATGAGSKKEIEESTNKS